MTLHFCEHRTLHHDIFPDAGETCVQHSGFLPIVAKIDQIRYSIGAAGLDHRCKKCFHRLTVVSAIGKINPENLSKFAPHAIYSSNWMVVLHSYKYQPIWQILIDVLAISIYFPVPLSMDLPKERIIFFPDCDERTALRYIVFPACHM